MVQTLILCLFIYFPSVKPSEIISRTPKQFLMDFSTEMDLKSFMVIKETRKGRKDFFQQTKAKVEGDDDFLLKQFVKELNSENKMVAVANYPLR